MAEERAVTEVRVWLSTYGDTDDLGYREVNPYEREGWEPPASELSPITCPGCGATMLECVRRRWETSLRCPGCKIKFTVHSG